MLKVRMYDNVLSDGVFKRNGFSAHKTSASFGCMKNALLMMANIFVYVEIYLNKLSWLWS